MPSRSGGLIKDKFERLLDRDLEQHEVLVCEGIALHWHTGSVLSYLERLAKQPVKHMFDMVAAAILKGKIKLANRGERQIDFTGRITQVYKKMDLFHPGMSDGEMQAVVELTDRFSDAQIDRALVVARSRGVNHVRYVLGVCVGNKEKPAPRSKTKIKEKGPEPIRPSAAAVDASWSKSLGDAEDRKLLNEIERMVNRGNA